MCFGLPSRAWCPDQFDLALDRGIYNRNACRGWLMERIAAEPEVTVRGLMTELAERGVAVSYGTVWNFIHREGMSFKKKRAAGRARSPRRGAPPGALEKISDED